MEMQTAQDFYNAGVEAWKSGNYRDATFKFAEAYNRSDNSWLYAHSTGTAIERAGDPASAAKWFERAVDLATDDKEKCQSLYYQGQQLILANDSHSSPALLSESLQIARNLKDMKYQALCLYWLGVAARNRGDVPAGYFKGGLIRSGFREVELPRDTSSIGSINPDQFKLDELELAASYFQQARDTYAAAGIESGVLLCTYHYAWVLFLLDRVTDVRALLTEDWVTEAQQRGMGIHFGFLLVSLWTKDSFTKRERKSIEPWLNIIANTCESQGRLSPQAHALRLLASYYSLMESDPGKARNSAESALAILDKLANPDPLDLLATLTELIGIYGDLGMKDRQLACVQRVKPLFDTPGAERWTKSFKKISQEDVQEIMKTILEIKEKATDSLHQHDYQRFVHYLRELGDQSTKIGMQKFLREAWTTAFANPDDSDPLRCAITSLEFAEVLAEQGKNPGAKVYFAIAVDYLKKLGDRKNELARAYIGYACAYLQTRRDEGIDHDVVRNLQWAVQHLDSVHNSLASAEENALLENRIAVGLHSMFLIAYKTGDEELFNQARSLATPDKSPL
ncbi:hypothetical protein I6I68_00695 [Corynebacterium glucuronolyticum]|uniref:hypothetical protein n=1 Tax=Corynebacterium glucuronolyticum TaxID=39791 RepID=UPI00191DA585|nr:hypothetical protein [Corynebacterium glucuronolyticum]QQU88558.1 hypothetical protein I6I68_00695 [Corynebacterium glucuronolyticum]